MNDENKIKLLEEKIYLVHFTEFTRGSELLKSCSEINDPRLVYALLFRHNGLMNKEADSAHLLRQAIKKIDGPKLNTLWEIIDQKDPLEDLSKSISDPSSMIWEACYVIGEIGGSSALRELSQRLSPRHAQFYHLYVRMLSQLLLRYMRVIDPEEPMINQLDLKTNKISQASARTIPGEFARIMLRRREENEFFVPISKEIQEELIEKVKHIPDEHFNITKNQMLLLLSRVPLRNENANEEEFAIPSFNEKGERAGRILHDSDGRFSLLLDQKSDQINPLSLLGATIFEDLSDEERRVFSKWANLDQSSWTPEHYQIFSIAFLHYLNEIRLGNIIHTNPKISHHLDVLIKNPNLPPLSKPMSGEILSIFKKYY
jgi:hypothetical protein